MSQETDPAFSGVVRLYAPYGASVNGVLYSPDADDIIVVPSGYAVDLLSFPPICPEAARPSPDEANTAADMLRRLARTQGALDAATILLTKRDKEIAELAGQLHRGELVVDKPVVAPSAAKPAKA
jgi:hypothetical protein